jgi:hypothetical protein
VKEMTNMKHTTVEIEKYTTISYETLAGMRPALAAAIREAGTGYDEDGEIETTVEFQCRYYPGNPGRTTGPWEDCYPPEPAEVEYDAVVGGVELTDAEITTLFGSDLALVTECEEALSWDDDVRW